MHAVGSHTVMWPAHRVGTNASSHIFVSLCDHSDCSAIYTIKVLFVQLHCYIGDHNAILLQVAIAALCVDRKEIVVQSPM